MTETSITCFHKYFIMPIEGDEILKISFIKYLKAQSLELATSLHSTASLRSNLEILNYKVRIE